MKILKNIIKKVLTNKIGMVYLKMSRGQIMTHIMNEKTIIERLESYLADLEKEKNVFSALKEGDKALYNETLLDYFEGCFVEKIKRFILDTYHAEQNEMLTDLEEAEKKRRADILEEVWVRG